MLYKRSHGFLAYSSKGVREKFSAYITIYGGIYAISSSPYLWLSVIFTIVLFPIWIDLEDDRRTWVDLPISILPSMLGFTIGAFSIIVGVGLFKDIGKIFNVDEKKSYFLRLNASFVHFILVQTTSLFVAFLTVAYGSYKYLGFILSLFGFILFIYAISVLVAISFFIFSIGRFVNMGNATSEDPPQKVDDSKSEN